MTDRNNEIEIDVPELGKKLAVSSYGVFDMDHGPLLLFIKMLIAADELKDPGAGLNPPHPTHEITQGTDGRSRLLRLRFISK